MVRLTGTSSGARLPVTTVLVFAGCYAGASADVWFRFPCIGAAVLFPSYAVVTAALLRTRPRDWWILLVAASVGDFHPHRLDGTSIAFVLSTEGVNHLRAVLAAVGLRRFAGKLETLHEMAAYLAFAVLLAPFLAALAGASVVLWFGTSMFWLAFQEWWLSNAVTGLTLLPLLTFGSGRVAGGPRVRLRRIAEASAFVLTLAAAGAIVFADPFESSPIHQAHLYWALPFLLWAAVRLGPRETSAALLAVTAPSIWGAMHVLGPFAHRAPIENLLELQMFLLSVSVPLLLLAVLVRQQARTAAALAETRVQYLSVVEHQTEMICRFRPDGAYTFANRAYSEAFGLARQDVVGRSIWGLTPRGVHPTASDLVARTPASPIATREVKVATRAGRLRWQHWQDRAFFDERGTVIEYQAVGRDVTDRKVAEHRRRELEARKSVEVALREAERRKEEFLAVLGNELRRPLTPIGSGLEVLRVASPAGGDAQRACESIGRELTHMAQLVDDLLALSRVALGQIELQIETVDVARLIANAVESSRPLIESFKHQLTVHVPHEPVLIRGDAVRLTLAIANLLNDAAVYTEPGGRIDVDARRVDHDVRFSVHDGGIGHSPDSLRRILERVSQIPPGRERVQRGIGTGLALVRQVVELHGGSVLARSEDPTHGGEILVHLPALMEQMGQADPGIDAVEPVPVSSSPTPPSANTETVSTPPGHVRIDADNDDHGRDARGAIPRGGGSRV